MFDYVLLLDAIGHLKTGTFEYRATLRCNKFLRLVETSRTFLQRVTQRSDNRRRAVLPNSLIEQTRIGKVKLTPSKLKKKNNPNIPVCNRFPPPPIHSALPMSRIGDLHVVGRLPLSASRMRCWDRSFGIFDCCCSSRMVELSSFFFRRLLFFLKKNSLIH